MASGVECSLNHAIASSALGKHAHARIFWIAEDLIRALPSQTQRGWEQIATTLARDFCSPPQGFNYA